MECPKKDQNLKTMCTCTYMSCTRRGVCCECLAHHISKRQLPGCVFPKDAEKTYDRSFEHFAKLVVEKKV